MRKARRILHFPHADFWAAALCGCPKFVFQDRENKEQPTGSGVSHSNGLLRVLVEYPRAGQPQNFENRRPGSESRRVRIDRTFRNVHRAGFRSRHKMARRPADP